MMNFILLFLLFAQHVFTQKILEITQNKKEKITIERNTTLKFKYNFPETQTENIITVGFDNPEDQTFEFNPSAEKIKCTIYSSTDEIIEPKEDICSFYYDKNIDKYHYSLAFKKIQEAHYLLIEDQISLLNPQPNFKCEYSVFVSENYEEQTVEELLNIYLDYKALERYSPSLIKVTVEENFSDTFILYADEKKSIKILEGESIFSAYSSGKIIEANRVYIFRNEEGIQNKISTFFIQFTLYSPDLEYLTVSYSQVKDKIEYRNKKNYSKNRIQLFNCAYPKYYVFTDVKEADSYFSVGFPKDIQKITSDAITVKYRDTFGDEDTGLELLNNLTKTASLFEVYKTNDIISFQIECKSPKNFDIYFIDDEPTDYYFGNRMYYLKSKEPLTIPFKFYNSNSAVTLQSFGTGTVKVQYQVGEEVNEKTLGVEVLTISHSTDTVKYVLTAENNSTIMIQAFSAPEDSFTNVTELLQFISDNNSTSQVLSIDTSDKIIYLLNKSLESWSYLEVKVKAQKKFDSYFGYYQKKSEDKNEKYSEYVPFSQRVYNAENLDREVNIIYKNPYLIEGKSYSNYYFMLITEHTVNKFQTIQVIYHSDYSIFGDPITNHKQSEIIIIDSSNQDTPLLFSTDSTELQNVYVMAKTCSGSAALRGSTLQGEALFANFPLSTYYVYGSKRINSRTQMQIYVLPYSNDVMLSYIIDPSTEQIAALQSYERLYEIKLYYNKKQKSFTWQKFEGIKYEVFIVEEASQNKDNKIENDCYLNTITQDGINDDGLEKKTVKTNVFDFSDRNLTKNYVVSVVGIVTDPLPLRLWYGAEVASEEQFLRIDYPESGEYSEDILTGTKGVVLVFPPADDLVKNDWDYALMSIEDTIDSYYYKKDIAESNDTISLPIASQDKSKTGAFKFHYQNTPERKNLSGTEYFAIKFIEEKNNTKICRITFKFAKKDTQKDIVELESKKTFVFNNFTYLKENLFLVNDLISKNSPNEITAIFRKCSASSNVEYSITNVFDNVKGKKIQQNKYKRETLTTYIDVFMNFTVGDEITENTLKYNGVFFSYCFNLTDEDKEKVKNLTEKKQEEITFIQENSTFIWNKEGLDKFDSYEVYVIKNDSSTFNEKDNYCYLSYLKDEAKEQSELVHYENLEGDKNTFSFGDEGIYFVTVVGSINYPIPFLFFYKTLQVSMPRFYIINQGNNTYELTRGQNKIFMKLEKQTEYDYISLRVSITVGSKIKYYYGIGNSDNSDVQKVPLLALEGEEKTEDGIYSIYNPNKKVALENNYYYLQIIFNLTEVATKYTNIAKLELTFNSQAQNTTELVEFDGIYYLSQKDIADKVVLTLQLVEPSKISDVTNIYMYVKGCNDSFSSNIDLKNGSKNIRKVLSTNQAFNFTLSGVLPTLEYTNNGKDYYNGFYLTYAANLTDEEIKNITNRLRKIKVKAPSFNNSILTWDNIDEATYEVYLIEKTNENESKIKNYCDLLTFRRVSRLLSEEIMSSSKITFKTTTENYLPILPTKATLARVVAVSEKKGLKIRFDYPIITLEASSTPTPDPESERVSLDSSNEKVEIQINKAKIYFKLPSKENSKKKWDYVSFEIDSSKKYFVSFALLSENEVYTQNTNLKAYNKKKKLIFKNNYSKETSHNDKSYNLIVTFPEESGGRLLSSKDDFGSIKYNFIEHKETENNLTQTPNKTFEILNKEDLGKSFLLLNSDNVNSQNSVSLVGKTCGKEGKSSLKFYSAGTEIDSKDLSQSYKVYSVDSFAELLLKIESKEDDFSGVLLSYATNLTEDQMSSVEKKLDTKYNNEDTQISYDEHKISWNPLFGEDYKYEIFIMKKTEENKKLIEDDCYLTANKNKNGVLYYETKASYIDFNKEKEEYLVKVNLVRTSPISYRVNYGSVEVEIKDGKKSNKKLWWILGAVLICAALCGLGYLIWVKFFKKRSHPNYMNANQHSEPNEKLGIEMHEKPKDNRVS